MNPTSSPLHGAGDARPDRRARLRWLAELAPPLLVGLLAAGLRLYDLGYRSLWLDEVTTAQAVRLPDVGAVLDYVGRDPSATPLTYLVTWLMRPIGVDEAAIRVPYAAAGVLAVVAMYILGKAMYGRLAGLVAGVLLAILPYAIFYSQEARSYSFLMLFSALTMLGAYRAATTGRARDWGPLVVAAVLDLYTAYLAIAIVLAAYAYVGVILATDVARQWRRANGWAAVADERRRIAAFVASAALIGLAWVPWLGHFKAFLSRPDQGFGRTPAGYRPSLADLDALLRQLDIHGAVAWLVVVGFAALLIDTVRGRGKRALPPLAWLAVPLFGFLVGSGFGIVALWPRYFGAIYPAAVLMAAIGIVSVAPAAGGLLALAGRPVRRPTDNGASGRVVSGPTVTAALVAVALCLVVALDALPADAAAYTRPKGGDYRGAVDAALGADPDHPLVLVVGPSPDWTVGGLAYYSWARGSRLAVVDALKLDPDAIARLGEATSVWGASLATATVPLPTSAGLPARLFGDVWLIGPGTGDRGSSDRARPILGWARSFEPEAEAPALLIDVVEGHRTPGAELLPPPAAAQPEVASPPFDRWILQPGASLDPAQDGFDLQPAGRSINVYLQTTSLIRGGQYLMSFRCSTASLDGSARVFVVTESPGDPTTYPDGAGYVCDGSTGTGAGAFAFTVPSDSTAATIWLRASGTGTASFGQVSLRAVRP